MRPVQKLILIVALFAQNLNSNAQNDTIIYSFYTAGHAYGNPLSYGFGLHPPFVEFIPTLNSYEKIDFGVFTGDVVYSSTAAYWDSAQIDFDKLTKPFYIAPGNHDIGPEFKARFNTYQHSFIHKNDLHIIVTVNSGWSIVNSRLDFLIDEIENNYQTVNNIFIYVHQLIYWSPENKYSEIKINYEPQYPGPTNFESTILPLVNSYPNNFTFFSGDLGATKNVSSFMYEKEDNVTLIASGLGSGTEDNIIRTDIYADTLIHNIIAINGNDTSALGVLSNFKLAVSVPELIVNVSVYPNPFTSFIEVKNKNRNRLDLKIINAMGQVIKNENLGVATKSQLFLDDLSAGTYIFEFSSEGKAYSRSMVIKK